MFCETPPTSTITTLGTTDGQLSGHLLGMMAINGRMVDKSKRPVGMGGGHLANLHVTITTALYVGFHREMSNFYVVESKVANM